jgi:hypothetical protein
MNRIDLFLSALTGAQSLQFRYPQDNSVQSIVKQLSFLVELERGERSDAARLSDIIIGVLALKEVEPLDSNLAAVLYDVSVEVESMKRQYLKST